MAELAERLRAEVREFMVLPVAPDVLHRIQLGRVAGELLQGESAALCGDVVPDDAAAVRGQAVPDHEQLAPEMALEMREELDDLRAFDGPWEQPEVEVPPRHAGNRREQMPVEVVLEDGRLAAPRPSATAVRPLGQSALVDKDDRLPVGGSVFFSA